MYIPLEDGEEIVLKVHRHWLFIVTHVVVLLLFIAAPAALGPLLERIGAIRFVGPDSAWLVCWVLWVLIGWVMFWQFWTTYYMDVWVVTSRRIIDIDYKRLFDRDIAILRLDRVQDVTTRVTGIIGTLLKFGSVQVQSAGSDREFVINQIAHPERLRDAIIRVVGREAERLGGVHV